MWLALLLACGGGVPPKVDHFPDLQSPGASRAIPLHTRVGRYHFDTPSMPGVEDIGDQFVLESEEVPNPKGVPRRQRVFRAKLPFNVPGGRFAPPGLRLEVEGQTLAFERGKAAQSAGSTWRINGKHIVFSYPRAPEAGSVVAHWPGLKPRLERRDPNLADLPPEDFVRYDVTLKGETRHGLMLPAPASAEWDLDLPKTTTVFETWTALERAPLPEPAPDPATVVVSLRAGETWTELDRRTLSRDAEGFQKWSVNLSPWAGQSVTLKMEALPEANPWFDWVFLGSPTVRAKAEGEPRHILVLAMDTTRPDHLGFNNYPRQNTPELDAIGRGSVAFDRAWSVAPRTRPAFRSATTGRLPLDAVGQTNIAEVFQREGFATAGIVANVHLQPRFEFDHGFDWWHYDNAANADEQVDRALVWLGENSDRDTFLFLHFMDPHMPYRAPGAFRDRYVDDPDPTLPDRYDRFVVNRWSANGAISDQRKKHIEALHDGEMAWMSQQIGRLFDATDRLGGRSLSVIHTDHGEEFWDHGAFEHNHNLYDETTRVVFWVRPGGGLVDGRRYAQPATLMDIAPTLYDAMGFEDRPATDGRSLAAYLDGEPPAAIERPIPVGYLQYDRERWGVVHEDHKYILHTASGRQELYDLAADPGELTDLSATVDLGPWQQAMASAHKLDVRPGLRFFVILKPGSAPVTIDLPGPVLAADVLDPEADLIHRANREWGEPPRRSPADVGEVQLSPERTQFTFTPGREGHGILWVQAAAPMDPLAIGLERGGAPLVVVASDDGPVWNGMGESIRIAAGPVLVPPPGEAVRMGIESGSEDVSEEEIRKLCELGYLEPCPLDDP